MLENFEIGDVVTSDKGTMPLKQRMHIMLLGVDDVQKSATFYEALGWRRSAAGTEEFIKFDLGGYALSLISRVDLAKDSLSSVDEVSGFSGVAIIYIAEQAEDVPRILAKVVEAGGILVKPATKTEWGVAGYFKDPDGHLFEVDFEYAWSVDDDNRLITP